MMSDLEEPPAKVLKIDNIDGITRVTELSEMPADETFIDEQIVMGKESGIIEGGADEGQEEWLSEGVLTDDDLNPASQSQESQEDDHTDSQLGSSQEEEHLDTTMESEENDNVNDNQITETESNIPESESNIEMDLNTDNATYAESQTFTQSEPYSMDSEDNTLQNGTTENGTENVANETENVTNETENLTESVTNATESERNATESVQNVTDSVTSVKSEGNERKFAQFKNVEMNIEETMEQMEGAKEADVENEVFDSLLIKKPDITSETKTVKPEPKDEEDGNDTDDLLRMLGEDDSKTKKKLTKTVKDIRMAATTASKEMASSDEDDDFVYESTTVKKIKAAKAIIAKKQPVKAEPEDSDASGTDTLTVQRMFGYKKKPNVPAKKVQAKPAPAQPVRRTPRNIVNVVEKPASTPTRSQPPRQYQNKRTAKQSTPVVKKPAQNVRKETVNTPSKPEAKPPSSILASILKTNTKRENETRIQPSSVRETDDAARLDEEEFGESDLDPLKDRQRIMRPEMMDEEMPSDGESHSEDGSLYDELPSSDSEDIDDWFQIDIRAETAGDYLPLLGSKAKVLLQKEERRVSARLLTLKQSLSALTDSGKRQADQLRDATMALAELDDMLKAS